MFDIYIQNHFLKTPRGNPFQVPTLELVKAIEEEWEKDPSPQYQKKTITSLVASALDRASYSREVYTKYILKAVTEDVVLFRVEATNSFAKEQEKKWKPVIDTINQSLGLSLKPTSTLSIETLSSEENNTIKNLLERQSDFKLVGFSHLITLSESFSLSFLVLQGILKPDEAWDLAHLDEHTQRRFWGSDKEAEQSEITKRKEFQETVRFLRLLELK